MSAKMDSKSDSLRTCILASGIVYKAAQSPRPTGSSILQGYEDKASVKKFDRWPTC